MGPLNMTYLHCLQCLFEHLFNLYYNVTATYVAQCAGRALGLLIAKCKATGGLQYRAFVKLYESTAWPIITYGASIWGTRPYSCINSIECRAMRFFLGTGRYTPNNALYG